MHLLQLIQLCISLYLTSSCQVQLGKLSSGTERSRLLRRTFRLRFFDRERQRREKEKAIILNQKHAIEESTFLQILWKINVEYQIPRKLEINVGQQFRVYRKTTVFHNNDDTDIPILKALKVLNTIIIFSYFLLKFLKWVNRHAQYSMPVFVCVCLKIEKFFTNANQQNVWFSSPPT